MSHPMADAYEGEALERDRLYARRDQLIAALKDAKLSEFTVGQLDDLVAVVQRKAAAPQLERLEAWLAARGRVFKHGTKIRYRNAKGSKRGIGVVVSYPRRGSQIVNVRGPKGWAGWARVDELEIVK